MPHPRIDWQNKIDASSIDFISGRPGGRPYEGGRGCGGERKKEEVFRGGAESVELVRVFGTFPKMKMGKKWEDFFEKVWYNAIVDDGS